MQNFGFYLGVPLGIVLVFIVQAFPYWWVLPIGGVVIGYLVNYVGITMIFEPVNPRHVGPLRLQGLFLKRQPEVSDVFARLIADDVINLHNVGNELLYGPRSDRTRQMLEDTIRPAVDKAVGRSQGALRVAIGSREYDRISVSVAPRGHRLRHGVRRRAVRTRTVGEDLRLRGPPDAPAALRRVQRAAALGHQAGRVVTVPPRRGARLRRRAPAPGHLRSVR